MCELIKEVHLLHLRGPTVWRGRKFLHVNFLGFPVLQYLPDGKNLANQLIGSLSHFFKGFIHPRWCRISSINSINWLKLVNNGICSLTTLQYYWLVFFSGFPRESSTGWWHHAWIFQRGMVIAFVALNLKLVMFFFSKVKFSTTFTLKKMKMGFKTLKKNLVIEVIYFNQIEPWKKKNGVPYFPWSTSCLMTGSLCHGLWNNPPHTWVAFHPKKN